MARVDALIDAFETLTPEACYWAGVLATDGCVNNTLGKKTIAYGGCDLDLAEGFANFIGGNVCRRPGAEASYFCGQGRDQWRVRVIRPATFDGLVSLGITERKSLTLQVSEELAKSRDFWRGAVDGDGSIVCRDGEHFAMNLSSSSRAFIDQFVSYLLTLDLSCRVQVKPQTSGNNNYVVTLCGKSCMTLLKELYSDSCFALVRKKALADICISQEKFYTNGRLKLPRLQVVK
jgi:hypothetical protein